MLKYVDTAVTFAEFPNEVSLCINISGCPCFCDGCHSPYLSKDIGEVLSLERLQGLIESNKGITLVGFMGGDSNPEEVNKLAIKCHLDVFFSIAKDVFNKALEDILD